VHSISQENDLHELSLVERQKTVPYKEYMEAMTAAAAKEKENYFFVGSYGGGLKANLWNLLLLNRLNQLSGSQFMERTVVMSGVSGGAVGIGNYTSLVINHSPGDNLDSAIFNIGESNVLSNELVYFLGWDWVREYMPYSKYHGKDRSYLSMKLHAQNTGMDKALYNKVSYGDYWYKAYQKKNKRFPVLIMNSTSVAGKQGVAATIPFPDSTFAGADKLSSIFDKHSGKEKSLAYYGAVSTTNRFPIFSPTAKIPGKGNYLDGGYFDNSGMLSALEVYDAIARDSVYKKKVNPVFINIINSKDFYIRRKIEEWGFETDDVKESGEIASILETVASIDKLPRYIYAKIENRGFTIKPIMMPHKLSYENVVGVLKAKVKHPLALMDSIKKHNAVIDSTLRKYKNYNYKRWGVVEPPLARILGEPSVRYEEAMICCHPDVNRALERVLDFMATDTLVTNKNQNKLHRKVSKFRTKDGARSLKADKKTDTVLSEK
jgi:hypothetical protein